MSDPGIVQSFSEKLKGEIPIQRHMKMKRISHLIIYLMVLAAPSRIKAEDLSHLPEPYCHVNLMPYNPDGWYQNSDPIQSLIEIHHVKSILEVGSWFGLSTRHMASLLPSDGKVYAVDTWLGSPNEIHDPEILRTLYDQFLSNVIHSHLTDKIIPHRMDSLDAANTLPYVVDMIYLDATHEYEAVLSDLKAWFPHVKSGGIFCGDDWAWGDRGVERAVIDFATENSLTYSTNGWFWQIIKP